MTANILAFAGSLRRDSYNKRLAKFAATAAGDAGADVTFVDLIDYQMPIFNEDDEAATGLPETAVKFRALMKKADGFIISSPEYNSSYSAVLKNTIDWASRPVPDEQPLECFRGKVCGIMGASPGGLGGIRMLPELRRLLGNIGVIVLPTQYALSFAADAFDDDGALKDDKHRNAVAGVAKDVVRVAAALKG